MLPPKLGRVGVGLRDLWMGVVASQMPCVRVLGMGFTRRALLHVCKSSVSHCAIKLQLTRVVAPNKLAPINADKPPPLKGYGATVGKNGS